MQDFDDVDPLPDPEPIPLTQSAPIPPFPVDAFPETIADMVDAVAEATQTDPAMPAASALSTLSACTGGRAEIEIRRGWREPLVLYTATVAESGERKSSVQQSMTRPIYAVEARLVEANQAARVEAEARKQVATKNAEKKRNNAVSGQDKKTDHALSGDALADAIAAALEADAIEVPPIPQIIADDITPEATASRLAEQGGRLAIVSAEGGVLDTIAGRYSKTPNMDVFLKGHAGDPLKVDRIGRPPVYIPRPALTLGLMIQRQVLSSIAAHCEFRSRGFLARILYGFPVSKVGSRVIAAAPVDEVTEKAYGIAIEKLAAGLAERGDDPAILTLSPAAQTAFRMIEEAVEPSLADDGELGSLKDWGSKYCGAIARIAGILHLAEHGADHAPRVEVSAATIRSANRIGTYFKACAINAFAEMGTDRVTADAIYLLDRITRLGQDEVSERDMQRAAKRFQIRADLLPAVERLVEHGYLFPQPAPKPTGGRPPSPRYTVTKGHK